MKNAYMVQSSHDFVGLGSICTSRQSASWCRVSLVKAFDLMYAVIRAAAGVEKTQYSKMC
jgi:hypothetical protein